MSCNEQYDICIEQGASLSLPVTVTGFSLTGASAIMQIRRSPSSPLILELSTTNGKLVIAGSVITINITTAESKTFTQDWLMYDLFVTQPSGTRIKLMAGKLTVGASITQF
jgi:hypothetical protein